jgi:hypothetical protein
MEIVTKYQEALASPTSVYEHPEAVVGDDSLSDGQKLKTLNNREDEATHLQESEGEVFTEVKRACSRISNGP